MNFGCPVGQGDVESHGERALVGHQPARNVFRHNLNVGADDGDRLSVNRQVELLGLLKCGNVLLAHLADGGRQLLHNLAVLWSQNLEIGLDALNLNKAAQVYEKLGNNKKALALYKTIKEDFAMSQEAMNADKNIEKMNAEIAK